MLIKVPSTPGPIEDGLYTGTVTSSIINESRHRATPQIRVSCQIEMANRTVSVNGFIHLTKRSARRAVHQLKILGYETPVVEDHFDFHDLHTGEDSPIVGARCRMRVETHEEYGTRVIEFLPLAEPDRAPADPNAGVDPADERGHDEEIG